MEFKVVDINDVNFDLDNPRIASDLSVHEGTKDERMLAAQQILLGHISESRGPASDELKKSIIASEGIIEPIILITEETNKYLCVEGNTRLAIYKDLNEKDPENEVWKKIPSLIHKNLEPSEINDLRLQAHFVGKKEWSPYAKGAFINKLLNETDKSLEQIQSIVGGNLGQVKGYMYAYSDFKENYEDNAALHSPNDYIEKENFSYFVEARKKDIATALETNGFSLKDFAVWVKEKKLIGAATHARRLLADVLNNDEARELFLKKNKTLKDAETKLPIGDDGELRLESASLEDLCDQLNKILNELSPNEKNTLKADDLTKASMYLVSNELLKVLEEIENL